MSKRIKCYETILIFSDKLTEEKYEEKVRHYKQWIEALPAARIRTEKIGKKKLAWHCFDSELYNIKLFRLASNLKTDVYGVLFWAVTVVNCDEDIENVRLSVGSNSSSMWWLNGEEVLLLSGDRRMVQDDAASKRLTLKKGKNVLRGAIINGPGMSDFCVRFVDENGQPVKNITISNQ